MIGHDYHQLVTLMKVLMSPVSTCSAGTMTQLTVYLALGVEYFLIGLKQTEQIKYLTNMRRTFSQF